MLSSPLSFAGIKGQALFSITPCFELNLAGLSHNALSIIAAALTLNFRMVHGNGVFPVFIGARGVGPIRVAGPRTSHA